MKTFLALALTACMVLGAGLVSAQDEPVTLRVWDGYYREAEQPMIEALNAEFVAAHPNVTIVREAYETQELTDLLSLALTESTGPDVSMINQGIANMGALVQAGLLLPLDDYAEQHHWMERYGDSLHARNSFSDDGARMGEGNLYGVSATAEVVGVYYHKDIFEEHGLSIPTTLAEFEALAQTLRDAGVTPIIFGSLDGWPAIHEYGALQNVYSDLNVIDALIFRRDGATFQDEANVQAAARLVEWADNGFFPEGFTGISYDDGTAETMFVNKQGAMWLTGSWMTGTLADALDASSVGFFLLPDEEGSEVPLATGGVGLAYGIRATTAQPDLAAEYIDLVTGPRGAELLLEQGFLPAAAVDPATLEQGNVTTDVVTAWNAIAQTNRVGHYLDWTVPYDELVAALQELLGGQVTPEEFVASVEAAYVEASE